MIEQAARGRRVSCPPVIKRKQRHDRHLAPMLSPNARDIAGPLRGLWNFDSAAFARVSQEAVECGAK